MVDQGSQQFPGMEKIAYLSKNFIYLLVDDEMLLMEMFIFFSFHGSPVEDKNFRTVLDEAEAEEASFSGQDDLSDHAGILEWAKVWLFL